MHTLSRETLAESERAALDAAEEVATRAYAPYSGFTVGAALVTEDSGIVTGCNVENASYGLTICAERAAVLGAVASGARFYLLLALWTPTPVPASPCGACRQFLAEFNPKLRVLMGCAGDAVAVTSLDELLPAAFSKKDTE